LHLCIVEARKRSEAESPKLKAQNQTLKNQKNPIRRKTNEILKKPKIRSEEKQKIKS
jgi:hypothetical protein